MEPLAKGVSSKSAKSVSNDAPKERSTSCRVHPKPCAGAWFVRAPSALQSGSSKRSYRVEAHWPHLMPTGPARASALTISSSSRAREKQSSPSSGACRSSSQPSGGKKHTSSSTMRRAN